MMTIRRFLKHSLTRRLAALVTAALVVGACSAFLPGAGPAPDMYSLTPKSTFDDDLPMADWQLVVAEPFAARGLDTNRIALHPSATEIKYFSGARWSDRAPSMVQTLLVESFENTGKIVAVGRQAIGLRSDYTLRSELREFQAHYNDGDSTPTVTVRLNIKIVKQPRQSIIASKTFTRTMRANGSSMKDIVRTFDDTLGKVLRRVVEWTMRNAK